MDRVDMQLLELENNITRLRKALNHWRALSLDYEGLKDEFCEMPENATKLQYLKLAQDFGPQKLDDKELNELFEPTRGNVRQPKQLVDILSRRVEYVSRNISSLKSQLDNLEKQKASIHVDQSSPEDTNLPVTEIIEELDEEGNVLSSSLQPQGDSASKVIDILKQVEDEGKDHDPDPTTSDLAEELDVSEIHEVQPIPSAGMNQIASDSVADPATLSHDKESELMSLIQDDTEEEAQLRREMLQYGLEEVDNIVAELELEDEADSLSGGSEVDIDELNDGDEEHSDFSDQNYSSEDEDEDLSGRTKHSAHSAAYRKRMEDLQKRLGLSMENVGPSPELSEVAEHVEIPSSDDAKQYIEQLPPALRKRIERPSPKEAARLAAIAREEAMKNASKDTAFIGGKREKPRTSKKVSFASELDIAGETDDQRAVPAPISSEDVVERDTLASQSEAVPKNPAKPSRFKTARNIQSSVPSILKATSPTSMDRGHASTEMAQSTSTHSKVLVERPVSGKAPVAPEADDFDEELQKRQIATEHHKLKNRIVHDQGGYVQGGELDNWGDDVVAPEIVDERTGQPKKMSRFKAARLKS